MLFWGDAPSHQTSDEFKMNSGLWSVTALRLHVWLVRQFSSICIATTDKDSTGGDRCPACYVSLAIGTQGNPIIGCHMSESPTCLSCVPALRGFETNQNIKNLLRPTYFLACDGCGNGVLLD